MKIKNLSLLLFVLIFSINNALSHPTGNLITLGDTALWSYINPIDDLEHHACIMIWENGSTPKVLLTSEFPASDFMLYTNGDHVYIIERKYLQHTDSFKCRVLKMKLGEKPEVIWDWFEDKWRVGEGGFIMDTDEKLIFASRDSVYLLNKNGSPQTYFEFEAAIHKVRPVSKDELLLFGLNSIWLVDKNGQIENKWSDLLNPKIKDPPLGRNSIFDADYQDGELLLAYWGKRSFDIIDKNGKRTTLLQQKDPVTPHWVAFFGSRKLLFSSKLILDGSTPKPYLLMQHNGSKISEIWKN